MKKKYVRITLNPFIHFPLHGIATGPNVMHFSKQNWFLVKTSLICPCCRSFVVSTGISCAVLHNLFANKLNEFPIQEFAACFLHTAAKVCTSKSDINISSRKTNQLQCTLAGTWTGIFFAYYVFPTLLCQYESFAQGMPDDSILSCEWNVFRYPLSYFFFFSIQYKARE